MKQRFFIKIRSIVRILFAMSFGEPNENISERWSLYCGDLSIFPASSCPKYVYTYKTRSWSCLVQSPS